MIKKWTKTNIKIICAKLIQIQRLKCKKGKEKNKKKKRNKSVKPLVVGRMYLSIALNIIP